MAWTNDIELEGSEGREIVSGRTLIATVYNPADADLIAAAPDLLAALKTVTACLRGFHASDDFGPLDDEAVDAALNIIAKAKGN